MQELENFFKWQNVKTYLKEKYNVTKESEDTLVFAFSFSDGRSQIVFIDKEETNGGTECIQIVSRIGEIVPKRVNSAIEMIAKTMAGGIIKMGDDFFVRSTLLLKGLDPEVLDDMMGTVVITADAMEKEFVGGDEN